MSADAGLLWLADLRPLDPVHLARYQRFLRPLDRLRFVARRGILRLLLGRHLGLHPAA